MRATGDRRSGQPERTRAGVTLRKHGSMQVPSGPEAPGDGRRIVGATTTRLLAGHPLQPDERLVVGSTRPRIPAVC